MRRRCDVNEWAEVWRRGLLADVGPVPDRETLIDIPEDVLKFYARRYQQQRDTTDHHQTRS